MQPSARIATFMFHEVTDDPASSGYQRPRAMAYKHTSRAFAQYLDAIAGAPVSPTLVTETDLWAPRRHLFLTFDDGGSSALAVAAELERRGWRGHFFIVTSLVGTRGFLTADGIRQLHAAGHLIGSHSRTHPTIFRDLTLEQMVAEWRTSCAFLEDLVGEPVRTASVPGGHISRRVLSSADATGLSCLFTSEPWLTPRRFGDCSILGRFSVTTRTSPAHVRRLAQFRSWRRALIHRNLKVLLTKALPRLYRLYDRAVTRPFAPAPDGTPSARSEAPPPLEALLPGLSRDEGGAKP